jgi:hypothetical protein
MMKILFFGLLALLAAATTRAGEANVIDVTARQTAAGIYHFEVTLQHDDTGWKHYADKWEVIGPNGGILATRILYHPHVNEQPFTRSLGGVEIPPGVSTVTIRGHDLVHGYGGKTANLNLPQ